MNQPRVLTGNTRTEYIVAHRPARDLLTGPVASITLALVVVITVGLFSVGPRFLSASNISIIGQFLAIPILVGTCAGFALLAGVVDLSIGSMVGVSAAIFGTLLINGWDVLPAAAATLVVCLAFGGLNAIAIVGFGADAIAATLGMLTALRGITYVVVEHWGVSGSLMAFHPGLFTFMNLSLWSLPLIFILVLLVAAVATLVVIKTRIGRHLKAAGGDERAALRAGISVPRVRTTALLISAFGAGLAGIIFVGQIGAVSRLTGFGLEFQVYAALMIGGYSILRGGVGNPAGGALGFLVIAGATNILDLNAINPYYVNIVIGLLLLAAVWLDRLRGGDSYE